MTSSKPTLCSNGCGFFGTAATKGLCSKCFNDYMKSITPAPVPTPSVTVSVDHHQVNSKKEALNDREFPWTKEAASNVDVAKKIRCKKCNKKVGLTGFKCRCGNMFCGSHRYAEAHGCDFDFKAKGRIELLKENPVVRAEKLQRF